MQEAWDALYLQRDTWEETHESHQHFLTRILGGKWTVTHKRVACDAIVGYARGKEPRAWATRFCLDRVNSFAFKKYTQLAASAMALEWCSRMQHYYEIYLAQDDPDVTYSQEQLDSYSESLEFITFMLGIADDDIATLDRARRLRAIHPATDA